MGRKFSGVWIPAAVWLDGTLTLFEKALLVEIDSLYSAERGGCFASNGYLGAFFNLSPSRVSEVITDLRKAGHLRVTWRKATKDGRIITVRTMEVLHPAFLDPAGGVRRNRKPPSENRRHPSENPQCIIPSTSIEIGPLSAELIKQKKDSLNAMLSKFKSGGGTRTATH